MNTFKEFIEGFKDGFNEMDPVQKQLSPGEKTAAIIITVHILGYILLSTTEGIAWATVCFMIYVTGIINVLIWYYIAQETYYLVKRILDNMEGMW